VTVEIACVDGDVFFTKYKNRKEGIGVLIGIVEKPCVLKEDCSYIVSKANVNLSTRVEEAVDFRGQG